MLKDSEIDTRRLFSIINHKEQSSKFSVTGPMYIFPNSLREGQINHSIQPSVGDLSVTTDNHGVHTQNIREKDLLQVLQ